MEQQGRRIGRKKPEDLLIRYNLEHQKREQQRTAPRFRGNGNGRGVVSHLEIELLGEKSVCV